MIKQENYNLEIAKLLDPEPTLSGGSYISLHPFFTTMSDGGGWKVVDVNSEDGPFNVVWEPVEFMLNAESALAAFDQIFPGERKIRIERDEYAWYAYDYIDDQHFGGGQTIAEAICEMILRKKRFEVEDH